MAWSENDDAHDGNLFQEDADVPVVSKLVEPVDSEEFAALRNVLVYDLWHGAEGSGVSLDRTKCMALANAIMSYVAARASYTVAHRICWRENRLPTLDEVEKGYRKLLGISDAFPAATVAGRDKPCNPKKSPAFAALRTVVTENPGTQMAKDLTSAARRIISRHRGGSVASSRPSERPKPTAGPMVPLASIDLPIEIEPIAEFDLPEIG